MLKEMLNKEMELRMVEASNLNMFLKDYSSKGEEINIKFSNPLFLNIVYSYIPLYKIRRILKNDKIRTEITLLLYNKNISVAGLDLLKELVNITFNKSLETVICMIENLLSYCKKEKINDDRINGLYKTLDLNVYVFKANYPKLMNKFLSTIGFIKLNKDNEFEDSDYLKIVEAALDVLEQYDVLLSRILSTIADFNKIEKNCSNCNLEPKSAIRE